MPIEAVLDHVAIAVPDRDVAAQRWAGELGGGTLARAEQARFAVMQLRFAGDGKLELLSPPPLDRDPDNFVRRFLDRFGAGIHHITLKVPDLGRAVATVRDAGYDVVDVDDRDPLWHEAFLRPSQVGGLVVQLARQGDTDEQWAARTGTVPEAPRPGAAELRGPLLAHPDLDAAGALWALLGAEVSREGERVIARWPGSALSIATVAGAPAGPRGLRFAGSGSLPPDNAAGPPVLEESGRDRA